jgi:hypothetical protein
MASTVRLWVPPEPYDFNDGNELDLFDASRLRQLRSGTKLLLSKTELGG